MYRLSLTVLSQSDPALHWGPSMEMWLEEAALSWGMGLKLHPGHPPGFDARDEDQRVISRLWRINMTDVS